MPTSTAYAARFRAQYRCLNCEKNTVRMICVPDVEEAPRDIDELLESAFFQNLSYRCDVCEGAIGTLIALKQIHDEVAA